MPKGLESAKPMKLRHNRCILVVIAHRDDEILGIGGTIAKHTKLGDRVFSISMTDGVSARPGQGQNQRDKRIKASLGAANIIGLEWLEGDTYPDNAMDTVPLLSVVKSIEQAKELVNPSLIYTHSLADLNIDHRIVCQACLTAFRPQPGEAWTEIRTCEIPSATDYGHHAVTRPFCPNVYIDISDTWQQKLSALKEYDAEMRDSPHCRSYEGLENLARLRGNQAGLNQAEAFEMLKRIER